MLTRRRGIHFILIAVVMALLVVTVACGDEDTATPRATSISTSPTATTVPAMMKPEGKLNVGYERSWDNLFLPWLLAAPMVGYWLNMGLVEAPLILGDDGTFQPRLMTEWSVDESGLIWDFKFQEGVEFHDGWGTFTVEDFLWTIEEGGRPDTRVAGTSTIKQILFNEDGWQEQPDDYTLKVHTGVLRIDILDNLVQPIGEALSIFSKNYVETVGEDEAQGFAIGTGPFALVDYTTGANIRLQAVEDHWRKTPAFDELVVWDIKEEATRLANFLTGALDTMEMALETKKQVEKDSEVRFITYPGANVRMFICCNQYPVPGVEPREAYDPDNQAWVSASGDVDSAEWDRARKVREAMAISIDRVSIANDLFEGEAVPTYIDGFVGKGAAVVGDLANLKWDFDPDRAKQLMTEAGYPNGFDNAPICLCLGEPGNIVGEAVASMWNEVGIRTELMRVPYPSISGDFFARSNKRHILLTSAGGIGPLYGWSLTWVTGAAWNGGSEHPFFEDIIPRAQGEIDTDARWALLRDIGRFLHEEALEMPVVSVNTIWPVGPKIEVWDLIGKYPSLESNNFEHIEPRKQ